jgi:hypothetical protein
MGIGKLKGRPRPNKGLQCPIKKEGKKERKKERKEERKKELAGNVLGFTANSEVLQHQYSCGVICGWLSVRI